MTPSPTVTPSATPTLSPTASPSFTPSPVPTVSASGGGAPLAIGGLLVVMLAGLAGFILWRAKR
jgi:hypothetical protein